MPLLAQTGLKRASRFLRSSIANRQASLVSSGLVFHFDPSNPACYPGTGTVCTDLTGINGNGTITDTTFTGGNAFQTNNSTAEIRFNRSFTNVTNAVSYQVVAEIPTQTLSSSYPVLMNSDNASFGGIYLYGAWETSTQTLSFVVYISENNGNAFSEIFYAFPSIPTKFMGGFTLSGSTFKLFVNGVERASATTTFNVNNQSYISLGAANQSAFSTEAGVKLYNGLVYNRALSDSEMLQNYNFLKPKYSLP